MIADYHIHIEKDRYSRGQLDACLEAGARRGVSQFGIAEHVHCFRESRFLLDTGIKSFSPNAHARFMRRWWLGKASKSISGYVGFVLKLKALGYPVKLGLELDFIPGAIDILERIVADYPWDFVLGSVHWLDGWGFDFITRPWSWRGRDLAGVYDQYFALVCEAAQTGLFDAIAHFDLVKIMGFYKKDYVRPSAAKAIASVAAAKMTVEVNTAGLRKPVKEVYPGRAMMQLMVKQGISFSLGSDAHRPSDVGRDFEIAVNLLKANGVKHIAVFDQRIREQLPL